MCLTIAVTLPLCTKEVRQGPRPTRYEELVQLFDEWRDFQHPLMREGVPDYSVESMRQQHEQLPAWQRKLHSFDTTGWPIKHQVDWYLIFAEMNGLDFDHRVLRPWQNDPAFYVWFHPDPSDVPEREGPNIYSYVELPFYPQPLLVEDAEEIDSRLKKSKDVFEQARVNLTGDGKDLWMLGIRSIREQSDALASFAGRTEVDFPELSATALQAKFASDEFARWLEEQLPVKQGASGIGKENYTWYQKNVHLMPYSYDEEEELLKRELARSHSALRFAEHRNRKLPALEKVKSEEEFDARILGGVMEYMKFLEQEEFMTMKPYMLPAMLAQVGRFYPVEGLLGFFSEIDYRDPIPMRAHHYHWIDKEREIAEPIESPIRRVPLLYNIFDSRAEGMATGMEELVMNFGLLENRPRAKELVYIMLAQRAARGLGGLYQHGLEMDFQQSCDFASRWVPWGLLPADGGTIQHEEHFYLQQPGYGSSYVLGKLDIDRLIAEYARKREGKFTVREFMDHFIRVGIIPTSLVYWEMTGDKSMLEEALAGSN